jgi:serine/threonine protein kinase
MKIVAASSPSNEVAIYHYLRQSVTSTQNTHVTQLLDSFQHEGTNGIHLCLVFEAMGPSIDSMVEQLPYHESPSSGLNRRYPTKMAKSILRQVLQGLVFLHEQGIVHADLQTGNVLFSVPSLSSCTPGELEQDINDQDVISQPVKRLDGKVDLWAPNYLVEPRSLADYVDLGPGSTVKLSDLGSGKYAGV